MAVMKIRMRSNYLQLPEDLVVMTPDPWFQREPSDFYQSGHKYRVLWYLHGATEDCTELLYQTTISETVSHGDFLVVCPTGLVSDFADHPQVFSGYHFPEFFFEELMPFVYGWLPASPNPEDNFISGYSMGGSGTLLLTLTHPDRFGGFAPMGCSLRESSFLEPLRAMTSAEFRALALSDPKQFPSEFARPGSGITLKEINMICKYPTVGDYLDSDEYTSALYPKVADQLPPMYCAIGTKDQSYERARAFEKEVKDCGVTNAEFHYLEGYGHGPAALNAALPGMLSFFGLSEEEKE